MSNDDRKQIINSWAIDSASAQHGLSQAHLLIGLQEGKIERLEAEVAELKLQRDAWKTTAIALEQQPERLKHEA